MTHEQPHNFDCFFSSSQHKKALHFVFEYPKPLKLAVVDKPDTKNVVHFDNKITVYVNTNCRSNADLHDHLGIYQISVNLLDGYIVEYAPECREAFILQMARNPLHLTKDVKG